MEQLLLEIIRNPSAIGIAVFVYLIIKSIIDWVAKWMSNKKIFKQIEILKSQVEHIIFKDSFSSVMRNHKELILNAFSFKKEDSVVITTEIIERVIEIFTDIMSVGYDDYDQLSLEKSFSLYEKRLKNMVVRTKLDLNRVLNIIQTEKSEFFIGIVDILPKTNGDRQSSYNKLCKSVLKNITKKMSEL